MEYIMRNFSREFLQKNQFRYKSYLSEYEDEVYTYIFPVYFYRQTATIECEIAVSATSGAVNVNVYNAGIKELYAAYYNRDFGKYEIIESIDTRINKKLTELGIKNKNIKP